MSEDQITKWFRGEKQTWDVDMHVLATSGPNGMRLAHFGNKDDTGASIRLQDMKSNVTGAHGINLKYNHTIGQPVCLSRLPNYLTNDLTVYFKDVLFPMAHSVHESAVSVMCSRWVIEFALQVAFTQLYRSSEDSRVQEQEAKAQLWQMRC
jgi:hypothetical protein